MNTDVFGSFNQLKLITSKIKWKVFSLRRNEGKLIPIGKAWYPTPTQESPGESLERYNAYVVLQFGYFQSVRPTVLRTLNVDGMII